MKLSSLTKVKKVIYSLEVFPPKQDTSVNVIYNTLLGLRGLPVDFISVTYGAGGSDTQKNKTFEISSLIRSNYHIEPVPHLTCLGAQKSEIQKAVELMRREGIENVLALRGDKSPERQPTEDFRYAVDLVRYLRETAPEMDILGACYPEGHAECDSFEEDLLHLKEKTQAGVSHLITQLFFDNACFYTFLEQARQKGIEAPIEAGIMPIVRKSQIQRIVSMCGASVPHRLAMLLNRYGDSPAALQDAGIFYATQQIMDLLDNDVNGIHLYIMNNVEVAQKITSNIESILAAKNAL